ncbi:DNA-methyltransferase [Planctomycetota bacterium]
MPRKVENVGRDCPAGNGDAKVDVYFGDNLPILQQFPDESFDLIYIDPPFNTGKTQSRTRIKTIRDEEGGDRTGFQGKRYRTVRVGTSGFADDFDDYLRFLEPRFVETKRLLKPTGSFFLHVDYREVHYCKVLLDEIFGRDAFLNEIIWAYDYGGRSKKRWSAKHDNILWYAKKPSSTTFVFEEMDRIPYMAPGLVSKEKAARGKTPTDVWWHTIVPTNGKERTGYPTQKPLGVLSRIVKVHSRPGDRVLDFFAGSGTTGEAAVRHGRSAVLVDNSEEAMRVMSERLAFAEPTFHGYSQDGADLGADGTPSTPATDVDRTGAAQRSLFDALAAS